MDLESQRKAAEKETSTKAKAAHRRYSDAVLNLSKAFSASASDEAKTIRDEVGFFQATRAALIKNIYQIKIKDDLAVQQIVNRAVISRDY